MEFIVIGGEQKNNAPVLNSEYRWKSGKILNYNLNTKKISTIRTYSEISEFEPVNSSIIFKSGSIRNNKLITCTNTEILTYDLANFQLDNKFSCPLFNDLHHVDYHAPSNSFYVVSTGLDALVQTNSKGNVINVYTAIDVENKYKYDLSIDYRNILSTKPHLSHPNFVTIVNENEIFLTRFIQRDAINIFNNNIANKISIEKPHDGVLYNNNFYYTTIDGHIIIIDSQRKCDTRIININKLYNNHLNLGWCRGICPINESRILVGFTRLRPTKFTTNISWFIKNFKSLNSLPTRIVEIDIINNKIISETNLEIHNFNGIFSILKLNL